MSAKVNSVLAATSEMSSQDLEALISKLQDTKIVHETKSPDGTEIISTYGRQFSRIVGVETILKLPVVKAEELQLDAENDKYYQRKAKPADLKEKSAVRGINGRDCPFVAIKIEMLDAKTHQLIGKVVEVIFKRYGNNGDGAYGAISENNYVSALSNSTDEGTSHSSCLYTAGGMREHEMQAVRDLLEGKEIVSPHQSYMRIRMAKN